MTPPLIVTDLDRTLLNADHDLDVLTIETFQCLAACGHPLALASGRHFHDIAAIRERLGTSAHIISTNGAYLHDSQGKLMSASHVPAPLVKALIGLERPASVRLNLYCDDEWLIDAPDPRLLELHAHTGFSYRVADLDALDGSGIGKVLYIGDPDLLAGIESQLRTRHGERLHITYSLPDSLEIMAGGVNKGAALQQLLDTLQLSPAQCLAFGDNLNDTEMLNLAGNAFMMANAHPELPHRVPSAQRIGHHDEMAVARQLREYFSLT
ncbi:MULTISPECIES: Cof-type HAD-IIB family hydrolase [Halomonadaceae]|uniref:Cof-type HAD-IIB family hydrolase n=1 Tax=Halomonadaceae TaxID=28256 RepID=UPI00159A130D|nr:MULTISPECIES: Cof-type HAD-IIB family hydrolase [Halomonas]QJQ95773.1 Cof-type HAD-IIB family hydrolase [Halomonas sp. PA5]